MVTHESREGLSETSVRHRNRGSGRLLPKRNHKARAIIQYLRVVWAIQQELFPGFADSLRPFRARPGAERRDAQPQTLCLPICFIETRHLKDHSYVRNRLYDIT